MNLHTRLIGAMHAVMLALAAFVTAALLLDLIEPASESIGIAAAQESLQRQQA